MLQSQLRSRAGTAILFLVFCLQFRTTNAQKITSLPHTSQNLIQMNMKMPQKVKAKEEITLKLIVNTEQKKCTVIKTYLKSNRPMDTSFQFKYIACLCENYPRTFIWDFTANHTIKIRAYIDTVRDRDICPESKTVVPTDVTSYYMEKTLNVVDY